MFDIPTNEIQIWLAIIGGFLGLGAIGWKIFKYYSEKSKCFELQKATIKSQNEKIDRMEKTVNDVKTAMAEELKESKETHVEIFQRMNENDKKLSYLAGKFGFKEED